MNSMNKNTASGKEISGIILFITFLLFPVINRRLFLQNINIQEVEKYGVCIFPCYFSCYLPVIFLLWLLLIPCYFWRVLLLPVRAFVILNEVKNLRQYGDPSFLRMTKSWSRRLGGPPRRMKPMKQIQGRFVQHNRSPFTVHRL